MTLLCVTSLKPQQINLSEHISSSRHLQTAFPSGDLGLAALDPIKERRICVSLLLLSGLHHGGTSRSR